MRDEPDQTLPSADETAFEIIESNRWFILGRDDEGYSIWPADNADDAPICSFPSSDKGAEDAFDTFSVLTRARRGSLVPFALLTGAAVAGAVWFLASVYSAFKTIVDPTVESEAEQRVIQWVYAISQTAYPAFVVLAGLFIMVWLHRRERARIR